MLYFSDKIFQIKVRDGLEPSLQDLQSHTLPLCYPTVLL